MNNYEVMYIVKPVVEEEAFEAVVAKFESLITANGGTVEKTDRWGKKRLAYEIQDFTEGQYVLVTFSAEPKAVKELDRVMKMINDNIGNPDLNVEMIAQEVGISRVHLHRKLKELTNQAPRELIKKLRLKQAAALLADKHRNITEVAIMTGFTSTTYFSTSFKELFGISPSAYMERYQKEENIEEKADSDKEEKAEK